MRVFKVLSSIRSGVWFVPVVCVAAGVALSFGAIAIDRAWDFELIPRSLTGGPDAALAILSTVALSMVSLATLVLTITMVVVQLAMGQFSPRIVQNILRDKPSQLAIGVFVATFAHAMLAMREIDFDTGQVPGLAILIAFVLVLVSIALLVVYVQHIGQSLRVASLIELVGRDTRSLIDEFYPDTAPHAVGDPQTITAPISGVVSHIDRDRLVELAADADCVLEMVVAFGEFVPSGAPLVVVHGDATGVRHDEVTAQVVLSLERTLDEDVAYGFRLLVDIAERSLSESALQDPTTTVQAIDRLHDCLRQMATRPFPDGAHVDRHGHVRLVLPVMDWDAYVRLAFDEIRLAGASSPPVTRRLRAALEDLRTVAPPHRRGVLDEQIRLLTGLVAVHLDLTEDAVMAARVDPQGIGVAARARE